jgi:hypothetical protein
MVKKGRNKLRKIKNTGSWGFWVAPKMKNGRDPPQIRVDIGKRKKERVELGQPEGLDG